MDVLPASKSVYHTSGWCPWRPEEALDFLELELQMVISHPVGVGNWTQVLLTSRAMSPALRFEPLGFHDSVGVLGQEKVNHFHRSPQAACRRGRNVFLYSISTLTKYYKTLFCHLLYIYLHLTALVVLGFLFEIIQTDLNSLCILE